MSKHSWLFLGFVVALAAPGLSAEAACNIAQCNLNDGNCVDWGCTYDSEIGTTICDVIGNQPAGTPCGNQDATACDAPDTCNSSGQCIDRVDPIGTECRAASGNCDVAETCTGTSKLCPTNAGNPGACTGTCDACACDATSCSCVAVPTACTGDCSTCTGSGNNFSCTPLAQGTSCRAAAGDCDVAESCDGVALNCPSDVLYTSNKECRGSAHVCDKAEFCTGADVNCPADAMQPNGTSCSDGDACTTGETCTDAMCGNGTKSLKVTPASLAFDPTLSGMDAPDLDLTVENVGTETLDITSVTSTSAEFPIVAALSNGPLNAGATGTVTVDFRPTGIGERTGQIDVATATCMVSASLSGEGELLEVSLAPPGWDFGEVDINAAAATGRDFTVTNSGTVPFDLTAVRVPQASPFTVALVSQATLPVTLAPGATFVFHIKADPTATGLQTADVSLTYGSSTTSFAVKVTGVCTTNCDAPSADGGTDGDGGNAGGCGCRYVDAGPLAAIALIALWAFWGRRRRTA